MITGDHGNTAASIAKKIGMVTGNQIVTGDRIDEMSQEELHEKVKEVSIFSRVVPEHKMRIVKEKVLIYVNLPGGVKIRRMRTFLAENKMRET